MRVALYRGLTALLSQQDSAPRYYFLTSLAHIDVAAFKRIPIMVRKVRDFRRGDNLGCPETPVKHYQSMLRKITERRRSHDTQQSICSIHNFDTPPSIIPIFR
jgi:hypothetical protein